MTGTILIGTFTSPDGKQCPFVTNGGVSLASARIGGHLQCLGCTTARDRSDLFGNERKRFVEDFREDRRQLDPLEARFGVKHLAAPTQKASLGQGRSKGAVGWSRWSWPARTNLKCPLATSLTPSSVPSHPNTCHQCFLLLSLFPCLYSYHL